MPATATKIFNRLTVTAAILAAPAAVMAASGALSRAAIPVALLLGVFLLALVWYLASAWALVERPQRTRGARRAVATPVASGAC